MKPEITQKVKSVSLLTTQNSVLENVPVAAVPEQESGCPRQTSLVANRRHSTSAVMIGLAISMGALGAVLPQSGDEVMAASEPSTEPSSADTVTTITKSDISSPVSLPEKPSNSVKVVEPIALNNTPTLPEVKSFDNTEIVNKVSEAESPVSLANTSLKVAQAKFNGSYDSPVIADANSPSAIAPSGMVNNKSVVIPVPAPKSATITKVEPKPNNLNTITEIKQVSLNSPSTVDVGNQLEEFNQRDVAVPTPLPIKSNTGNGRTKVKSISTVKPSVSVIPSNPEIATFPQDIFPADTEVPASRSVKNNVDLSVPIPVTLASNNSKITDDPYQQQIRSQVADSRKEAFKNNAINPSKNNAPTVVTTPNLLAQKFSPQAQTFPASFSTATAQPTAINPQSVVIPVPAPKTAQIPAQNRLATNSNGYYSDPNLTEPNDNQAPENTTTGEPSVGFIWPAKGVLTSKYGWRWGRMHKGVDIGAPIGTPIVAAADGVVRFAGWHSGGYGNYIEIEHSDGRTTRYAHNNRLWVATGQTVRQGEQVAELGNTGRSTGPHLHFEIRTNGGTAVNPMAFLPPRA